MAYRVFLDIGLCPKRIPGEAERVNYMKTRILRAAMVMLLAAVGSLSVASEANASCLTAAYWTSTSPSSSAVFRNVGTSDCGNLYAAGAKTASDYVKGWYQTSDGVWHSGSAGWVYVPTGNQGWKTLLSNLINGSTVKGETYYRSQYIQYVW